MKFWADKELPVTSSDPKIPDFSSVSSSIHCLGIWETLTVDNKTPISQIISINFQGGEVDPCAYLKASL